MSKTFKKMPAMIQDEDSSSRDFRFRKQHIDDGSHYLGEVKKLVKVHNFDVKLIDQLGQEEQ